MATSLDILNRLPGSRTDLISSARDRYNLAGKDINTPDTPKYRDQAELQKSGLTTEFNRLQDSLIAIGNYRLVAETAKNTLSTYGAKLQEIRGALTRFESDITNPTTTAGTIADRVNAVLKDVQNILNTKSSDGRYLFGGVNSDIAPCGDLVAGTNIDILNNTTTNFTTAASNSKLVQISDLHSVDIGLSANEQAFAKVIGAMNFIKRGAAVGSLVNPLGDAKSGENAINDAKKLLDQLVVQNIRTTDVLKVAGDFNDDTEIRVLDNLEETFQKSNFDSAKELQDAREALLLLFAVEAQTKRLFDDYFRLLG